MTLISGDLLQFQNVYLLHLTDTQSQTLQLSLMCSFRSTYALSNIFLLNFYAINFTINNINVKKKKFNEACVT